MTQLALDLDDPLAEIRTIVAEELASDALVTGVIRERYKVVAAVRWDRKDWVVDINPRRVICLHSGGANWSVHPTAAYAGMFEAEAGMTSAAIQTLERALQADDIEQIRAGIAQALGSLKQQPGTLDDIGLHARLMREIAKHDSQAAAARAWGVPRQTLHAALSGTIPVPPRILSAIGLRRVGQRSLYREV